MDVNFSFGRRWWLLRKSLLFGQNGCSLGWTQLVLVDPLVPVSPSPGILVLGLALVLCSWPTHIAGLAFIVGY